jgi:hypothetical protein
MSDSESESGYQTREVAKRVFAEELSESTYTFKESDDERAPTYALLPTGEKTNRVFFVGTLTETDDVGKDSEYWQGRIVDPTGTFFVYAGQYQPEPAAKLRNLETPAYVAVVGKPRSYETDDGEIVISIRPESITVVDASTRDKWVSDTVERTVDRMETFGESSDGYNQMATEQYGDDLSDVKEWVVTALESLDDDVATTEADTDVDSDSAETAS